jgi:hypothetical protein
VSRLREVPGWWSTLTSPRSDRLLLDLLRAVERAGVSKNDRPAVEHIWQTRQILRARWLTARAIEAEAQRLAPEEHERRQRADHRLTD